MVNQRINAQMAEGLNYKKPDDLLQYMMDGAEGKDRQPEKLAHLQLMTTIAGIHTTTMAITHAIYDLCTYPEYLEPLRNEIQQALSDDGGWGKYTANKLRKLDSFLKESQRFAPPTQRLCRFPFTSYYVAIIESVTLLTRKRLLLVGFNRLVVTPLTLSSGITIPAGTHLSVAVSQVLFDPAVIPNPEIFDGFRYYRKRLDPAGSHRYQYSSTDNEHLNFGHGKYACPGRFFASLQLKLLLSHLLLNYDFEFPKGQGRPKNFTIDEFIFPDPRGRIMLRERWSETD